MLEWGRERSQTIVVLFNYEKFLTVYPLLPEGCEDSPSIAAHLSPGTLKQQ